MKKVFSLLVMFSVLAFGQTENFSTESGMIVWQKVYETSLTKDQILENIAHSQKFKVEKRTDDFISGTFDNVAPDYQGAGFTTMGTKFYILNSLTDATFTIEIKDGKYRATVRNIGLTSQNTIGGGGLTLMTASGKYVLYEIALKKGQFIKPFLNKDIKIFDYTFSNIFDLSRYSTKKDW